MKIFIYLILPLLCCFATTTNAQLRKASDYFPMQIGNVWQYHRLGYDEPRQREAIGDTVLRDSLKAYKVLIKIIGDSSIPAVTGYYGYNSDSTVFYSHDIHHSPFDGLNPLPLLDTRHGINGKWYIIFGDVPGAMAITDSGSSAYFGQRRHWIEINAVELESDSIVIMPTGFHLRLVEKIGPVEWHSDSLFYAKINGVEYGTPVKVGVKNQESQVIPNDIRLRVYPNPMTTGTTFYVENIARQDIEIQIVDLLGRVVHRYTDQSPTAGDQTIRWDGKDTRGNYVPNGVYFVMVKLSNMIKTQKIVCLR